MKIFEPFLTTKQANRLSFLGCLACGVLLTAIERRAGNTRAAAAALPICFALGWFVSASSRAVDRLFWRR